MVAVIDLWKLDFRVSKGDGMTGYGSISSSGFLAELF